MRIRLSINDATLFAIETQANPEKKEREKTCCLVRLLVNLWHIRLFKGISIIFLFPSQLTEQIFKGTKF